MFESSTLNIIKFDSVAEMARYAKNGDFLNTMGSDSWRGDVSPDEAVQFAISGDDSNVPEAKKMLEKFSSSIETTTLVDMPSVAGCYPIVAEALAGEIECMREPQPVESESAPLTIVVDIGCSASIDAEVMKKRGIAILALVMALSTFRPIELFAVSIGYGGARPTTKDRFSLSAVRIETAPLDLATAAFALTHAGFSRTIALGLEIKKFVSGSMWPSFDGIGSGDGRGVEAESQEYRRRLFAYLGIENEALYIPGASAAAGNDMLREAPEQWVRQMLNKHGARETTF